MRLINSHIHSTGSDGKLTPEEMIKEAIGNGVSYICFCDHYKRPEAFLKLKGKTVGEFDYAGYMKNIKQLAEKYRDKIEVAFGTEMDWFEEFKSWTTKEIKKFGRRCDHIIGSVHYIKMGGEYFPVDATAELWGEIADKCGVKAFVEEYYRQLGLMIESKLFDCIGHFDLIKNFYKDSRLFDENAGWYKKSVRDVLDVASKVGVCMEINTHGFKKSVGVQYPSEWIINTTTLRRSPLTRV